jgi:hypothetical protein
MSERPNTRLSSWKEIAEYLERDVRTVARWEKSFGLPVHRVGGGKGRSVFAYTSEIDEWLARAVPNTEPVLPVPAAPPVRSGIRLRAEARWLVVAVLALLCGAFVFWTINLAGSGIADVGVSDNVLTAYDSKHRPLWTTPFDDSVIRPAPALVDLDGDGQNEVVGLDRGVGSFDAPVRGAEFFSMSGNGRRFWNFKPEISLKFANRTYGGPWPGHTWMMIKASTKPIFALAVHHYTWWPGVVITLDHSGKPLGEFVNSGWVLSFAPLERASKSLLLAGGISNSNDAAMLAVLDPEHPAGTSPEQPGSAYECRSCSSGKPLAYFIFPRSELNRASVSRFNQVVAIESLPDRVVVHVQEVDPMVVQTTSVIEAVYEFTPEMQPIGVRLSDQYWDLHSHVELQGKLKHSSADCPDRTRPRIVRRWFPESGWTEISVPAL